MEKSSFFSKPVFWANFTLVLLLGLLGANVIFGWTNPTADPPVPAGAIYAANGNVGIGTTDLAVGARLTVNGRLAGLSAPIEGADAANKAYVDAASGQGGGSVSTITVFGVSAMNSVQITGINLFRGPNGAVPPFCRNNLSVCANIITSWGAGLGVVGGFTASAVPVAGSGAPACSDLSANLSSATSSPRRGDWVQIFAGYGPHETIVNSFNFGPASVGDPNNWNLEDYGDGSADPSEIDIPSEAVSISDSVCSNSTYENVAVVTTAKGALQGVSLGGGLNSACSSISCNTCRICQWVPY